MVVVVVRVQPGPIPRSSFSPRDSRAKLYYCSATGIEIGGNLATRLSPTIRETYESSPPSVLLLPLARDRGKR